jgi:NAD(P)-dependent dehydrogenase (short-subunit alcohol dehydrogenase family)
MRTVFVTGAAHGIGLAAARAFASDGERVYLYDRDEERLPEAIASIAGAAGRVGDVRSRDAIRAALDDCEAKLGPVDVCLNHAGIGRSTHTLELGEAEWDEVISINLTGAFRVAQEVARRMVERGSGVILNMSSSGAIAAEPGHAHYAASKAGILALTRAMAHDLGPLGVRVCALCPGDVDTYEWDNVEAERLYRLRIPAGRAGTPEEVAAVYRFLASDDARQLNGAAFVVDGGMLAWE